jgi:hypothetical protein
VLGTVAKVAVVGGVVHHVTSKNAQGKSDAQATDYETRAAQDQADAQRAQDQAVADAVADTKQEAEMKKMQQQLAEMQAQQVAAAVAAPAANAAAPAGAGDALMGQLNQLSQLHQGGVLNDQEFTAAKAKLLG